MSLFDATKTVHTSCPVCHAVRLAGQDRAEHCLNDLDKKMGVYRPRPKKCLNAWNPEHDNEIPY